MDLDKLTAAAGGRHYQTREKIVPRIGVIAAKRRVTSYLRWTVTENEQASPPWPGTSTGTSWTQRLLSMAGTRC